MTPPPPPPSSLDECMISYSQTLWKPAFLSDNDFAAEIELESTSLFSKKWIPHYLVIKKEICFILRSRDVFYILTIKELLNPIWLLHLDNTSTVMDVSRLTKILFCLQLTVNSSCWMEQQKVLKKSHVFSLKNTRDFQFLYQLLLFKCGKADEPLTEPPSISEPIQVKSVKKRSMSMRTRLISPSSEMTLSKSFEGLKIPNTQLNRSSSLKQKFVARPLKIDAISRPPTPSSPTISRSSESFYSKTFDECHQSVMNTLFEVESFLSESIQEEYNSEYPKNFLEPCTILIRNTRHLLYYADGNYAKEMHNTDLTSCLGKIMAMVIDRIRHIGTESKKLTEQEYLGINNLTGKESLLNHLTDFSTELNVFAQSASSLFRLDSIIMDSKDTDTFSCRLKKSIVENCLDIAKCFVAEENIECIESSISLQSTLSSFSSVYIAHHEEFCSLMSLNIPSLLLQIHEMENAPIQLDDFMDSFENNIQNASDGVRNSITYLTENAMSISVFLVRLINTLVFLEENASDKWLMDHFWKTFELIVTPDENDKSSRCESMSNRSSFYSSPLFKPDEEEYTDEPFPHLPPPVLVRNLPVYSSPFDQESCMTPSTKIKTPLSSTSGSFALIKGVPGDIRKERHSSSISENPEQEYCVNIVISKSINEFAKMIMNASKNLRLFLRDQSPKSYKMNEPSSPTEQFECINKYSMIICTAASQIEEELGNLEGNSSIEASNRLTPNSASSLSFSARLKNSRNNFNSLLAILEDARQDLSRSVVLFEASLKDYTSFISSNSMDSVLLNLDKTEASLREVLMSMNNLISHQAFLVVGRNPAVPSLHSPPGNSNSISLFTSNMQSDRSLKRHSVDAVPEEIIDLDLEVISLLIEKHARQVVDELLEEERIAFENNPNVVFRDASDSNDDIMIRGGSLEVLVEQLTHHKLPSSNFTSAFLITYLSFTTASQLLSLLIARYKIEAPSHLTEKEQSVYNSRKIIPIRLRVFNVLKLWVKNNFEDFQSDPALLKALKQFLKTIKQDFSKGTKDFENLIARKEKGGIAQNSSMAPSSINFTVPKTFEIEDLDSMEVAHQLTLVQWEIFHSINPNECLNQSWNRKEYHSRSPNIRRMIKLSNYLVEWVATEIVSKDSPKTRANMIKYFISVAEKLRKLNNLDGLKAVICGIQSSGIRRLKMSWELVSAKFISLFEDLVKLMSEDRSSKNYRQHLHSINPPCIPFIGVYLTDLTMIEGGNPDQLANRDDLINFHKRYLSAQVIQELKRYQCTPYQLRLIPELKDWLLNRDVMSQEEIYEVSLKMEPRNISMDIKQDSNLKSRFLNSLNSIWD